MHSAAGGVGALALELCEKLGAFPVATIGSEAKASGEGGRLIDFVCTHTYINI